jgi:hypothetical protein
MKKISPFILKSCLALGLVAAVMFYNINNSYLDASSHREAPMIADDPLADNTDLYAFRSPDDTSTVTIIANYIPFELPQGGPNFASFGENIRYEVHIKNDAATVGDDITYRFTFTKVNEDTTTFFNIRLGKQNLKTMYKCEKSVKGGAFTTIVASGVVPPPNIGPRSIENATLGLGKNINQLITESIATATGAGGEKIFCGPAEDPFFVDLGGIFDLGQTRAGGTGDNAPEDGVACKNVHSIALKIPIASLQKGGKAVTQATNLLDGDFVIGVWASASRQMTRVFDNKTGKTTTSGNWVQVSRIGMPLTNEAVIPIGAKDRWNYLTPYNEAPDMDKYFTNPELALYMDDALFGGAVPGLSKLRIQRAAPTVLGNVDFGNGKSGLHILFGNAATKGSALDTAIFGKYLLRPNQPRSVDILPAFYTGVPNLAPYQLATGKTPGNPFTAGKPFVNNFLPTFGDMLRLNMATTITPRNHPKFSSLGLVQAAALGLTDPAYNTSNKMEWIPNMDGFPNGRRLEDDVTRIELQAVSGVVLAAVGLWYDDWTIGQSPLTPKLLNVLGYTAGVEANDTTFKAAFPYVQAPWSGFGRCGGGAVSTPINETNSALGFQAPIAILNQNYPNPVSSFTTFKYRVAQNAQVNLSIYDLNGRYIDNVVNKNDAPDNYEVQWQPKGIPTGVYFAVLKANGQLIQTIKVNVVR